MEVGSGGAEREPSWFVSDAVLVEPGRRAEPLAIAVDGFEITEFGSAEEIRARRPKGLVDFGRRFVVPTFVAGHTHLAMSPLRGITSAQHRLTDVVKDVFFRWERNLTEADVKVFSKMGAYECLLSGIGEVWDHYYYGHAVAEALFEVGLSGVVAPTLADEGGPFVSRLDEELAATLCIQENHRFGRAGIRAALGPHATDTVSDRLFERVSRVARAKNLPIHMHIAQSLAEVEKSSLTGRMADRVLRYFAGIPMVLAHGLYLSQGDIERLVEERAVLAFCPLSQVQFGFLGPARSWMELGGQVTVGPDTVASNDALSVQRELPWLPALGAMGTSFCDARMKLLAQGSSRESDGHLSQLIEADRVRQASESALADDELLRIGLGYGLRGVEGRARGTLAVNGPANFQVLDPDAPELFPGDDISRRLAYGDTRGALYAMVVAGKLVGEPGNLRGSLLESPEYRATLEEANSRRSELFERARLRLTEPPRSAASVRASAEDTST